MPTIPPFRLTAALTLTTLALAACGSTDNNGVRGGPQAVHPSPSPLAQGSVGAATPQTAKAAAAPEGDLAETLFDQYCVGKTYAQSQAALVASGKFGPPRLIKTSFSTFTTYPYLARARAGVTIVKGSLGGLQCSVGVENKGPNLYEDGRITRSG